ncbi:27242_t:CDS:1, partial [Racocetra persica]
NGKSIEPINIKEAIYLISDMWKQVMHSMIVHYWNKTKILPLEMNVAADTSDVNDINDLEQLLEELKMPYNCTKLSAEEYVNVNKEVQTMDTPTKESIVKEVLKEQGLIDNDDSDSEDEAEEEVIDDLVTYNEGKGALEVTKKYLKQSQF